MKRPSPQQPLSLAAAMLMALSTSAVAEDTAPVTARTAETPATTLPEIKVRDARERPNSPNSGYQSGIITSAKTKQLAKDIPQAITTVTEQLMLDSNADTMKSALRHVAGLTFNSGEGGRIGDNIMLRGFYSFGDLYLDGIRDVAQYNREVFHVEQIDVLRGSAAMLFGRGQAGGVINRVSKQPGLVDHTTVSTTVGSYAYRRVTADTNKVLGENTALRITAMKTDANSSRKGVETDREGLAPTLRWGIGTADEFMLGYLYLYTHNVPDYGVPFFDHRPLDVPASRFYGTSKDYENNRTNMSTGTYIHRFSPDTELKTVLRFADYDRDLWAVAPRLAAGTTVVTDATLITRGRQARGGTESTITSQTDLSTRFPTGPLKHEALVGFEWLKEKASRWSYNALANSTAGSTTVGDPDTHAGIPVNYGNRVRNAVASYEGITTGVYAQDQIEFLPGWKLLGGVRRDNMNADYSNGARVDYGEWSYRSGLLFQPDDLSTYYFAWSDSFNPTADLYQLTAAAAINPPERSRTIEFGTKWELLDGALSLRTSIYRGTKTWERNTDLEQAGVQLLSKKRHTDGIEIEAAGRITADWEVFAGLALMRARIDEAAPGNNPNIVGLRPRNAPPYTFNVWTTYRLDGNWRIGGGAEAKGRRQVYGVGGTAAIVPNVAPDYVRYDAMLAYEQPRYAFRLNVLNLFDKRYYEAVYENGGFAVPGTERAIQLTADLKF